VKKDVLARWWRIDLTDSDMAILRWATLLIMLIFSVDVIHKWQAGEIVRSLPSLGILIAHTTYAIGPQCWGIIEAPEGSNSRKALTLIVLFGFFLALSGFIARYTS
jgi:hypothetical protein